MNNFEFFTAINDARRVCPEFNLLLDLLEVDEQNKLFEKLRTKASRPAQVIYYVCEKIYNNN